jgi:hypothetical protein
VLSAPILRRPRTIRWIRLTATALTALASASIVGVILIYQPSSDVLSYLHAAEQMAAGEPFYGGGSGAWHGYVYAPWFAAALIPATLAPDLFIPLWHTFLGCCLVASVLPLLRTSSLAGTLAACLLGAIGFHGVWIGHVEPAVVALLVFALPSRWGPHAIAIAASLKIAPGVLALVYVGRGEWRKFFIAVGLSIALWAPILLFDASGFFDTEHARHVDGLVVAAGLFGAVATLALARSRYAWLTASVAWSISMPLMRLYDGLALATAQTAGRDGTVRESSTGRQQQYGYVVPMHLAPAGVLSGAGDEGGLGRQEDRIGSIRVEQ